MKKKMLIIIAIIALGLSYGFMQKTPGKAEWLLGTWEFKTSRGSIYETWKKLSTNEYSGESYLLKEKDTVVFETIRLVSEGDSLYYIPAVKNQNKGMPVRFVAKEITATQLVFENKAHDFPQRISYTLVKADSLVAEISGKSKGKDRKEIFPMKKVK